MIHARVVDLFIFLNIKVLSGQVVFFFDDVNYLINRMTYKLEEGDYCSIINILLRFILNRNEILSRVNQMSNIH